MNIKELRSEINDRLKDHATSGLAEYIDSNSTIAKYDPALATAWYLSFVAKKETADNMPTVYDKCESLNELTQRFNTLKFLLRRLEFGLPVSNPAETRVQILDFFQSANVSAYELMGIINSCCTSPDNVINMINAKST